jgi:hypothetical protein
MSTSTRRRRPPLSDAERAQRRVEQRELVQTSIQQLAQLRRLAGVSERSSSPTQLFGRYLRSTPSMALRTHGSCVGDMSLTHVGAGHRRRAECRMRDDETVSCDTVAFGTGQGLADGTPQAGAGHSVREHR